jgi:hypothetical protein
VSRARSFVAFAACLLGACDDGVLRAFEPHPAAPGGLAGFGGLGGSSSSAAGDGGRGGMAAVNPAAGAGLAPPTSPLLIDDFEDGDMRAQQPLGWWYPVNDSTSSQGIGIEPVGGSSASVYALRTHGSGFTSWGAAVGVDLVGDALSFNALGYERLCFVARVEAGTSSSIQVHFLRDPGVHYLREMSLTEVWTRYCVPLVDFIGTDQDVLVPDDLIALQFFFAPQAPFELWLDDIALEP